MSRKSLGLMSALSLLLAVSVAGAYTVGNPVDATGSGKLAVSAEYEYQEHRLPDVEGTESTRYLVKAGYGLTPWLDVFVKGGAANLEIPLVNQRFVGEDKFAWGAGARATLWRPQRWPLEVFSSGQIFSFRTNGRVDQEVTGSPITWTRRLDSRYIWWEYGGALGVKIRQGAVSPYLGLNVSYVEGEKITHQYNIFSYGTVDGGQSNADFSSEEVVVNGFGGLDVILPLRYRLSLEVRGNSSDQISFTIGISQRSR
jgi:hypothetical protein